MVPRESFLQNLELCRTFGHVDGDFVECGVWRGGMSAAIAEVLGKERSVHLFDSFAGLPPAQEIDGKEALDWQRNTTAPGYFDNCAAEERYVVEAMRLAGHTRYTLHRGWFEKTIPGALRTPIGILRLDGDWYDSIRICLEHLFPLVSEGGIVVLDDYYTWDGCSRAVHDYLSATRSPSRVHQWRDHVAYILKKN
jgi:O-methyltransferase